ncbi:MAG TPA: FAD-dependent monooxygenase, partial [Bacteroidia bacterium]|nr:FAD-dependent monooxygenase [Bacteroidia bacterium]
EAISAGRSINLALSHRGWGGLRIAGIEDEIKKVAIPMHGRVMHAIDGKISYQPYGKEGEYINSVSRGGLNCELMTLAEQHGVEINFNKRAVHVDLKNNIVFFEDESGYKSQASADLIFGSDGAYSAARLQLQLTDRYNYSQSYLEHGYKELTINAGANQTFKLEKNALHIWPRGGYMLIALPNLDGSFTCTLFFPHQGKPSFESLTNKAEVQNFFTSMFPDAVALMPNLVNDFFSNPTGSLITVKCAPWTFENKLMLIGDAAHAIVPFFGQGMNCGFEDCAVLHNLITKHNHQWNLIMAEFEKLRKPAADGIAELAVQNFIEMRDLVGKPEFLLRKKIEAAFSQKFPRLWKPLYSMVTFSDIPYHQALAEGKRQDAIMEKIMALPLIETNWDSDDVINKMHALCIANNDTIVL